jgi:hypothetical protein
MKNENTTFNVNGTPCYLSISQDDDGDCIKLWHDLVSRETNKVVATLGWSPYSVPSDVEVQQLIDLGLPDGLRWSNSHPLSRFNFDSEVLADFIAAKSRPAGKINMELVFRVRPALAA